MQDKCGGTVVGSGVVRLERANVGVLCFVCWNVHN